MEKKSYPKPGPHGGKLIRRVIRLFREFGFLLPLDSHILIALSGGSDSVALALLLAKYGRRIVPSAQLRFLHVNHRWRGQDSDDDAQWVQSFGHALGIPVDVHTLEGPPSQRGESWENEARSARKKIYLEEAARYQALVFSAHQGDDLAETVLWRLFTGSIETHAAGIAFRSGVEIRPFLSTRKEECIAFLGEENQTWREDATNQGDRFLRAKMRKDLMPILERLFPRSVEHLMNLGFKAQSQSKSTDKKEVQGVIDLIGSQEIRVRRSHVEWIKQKMNLTSSWKGEIDLPDGWQLLGERQRVSEVSPQKTLKLIERWVLQREQLLDLKGKSLHLKKTVN